MAWTAPVLANLTGGYSAVIEFTENTMTRSINKQALLQNSRGAKVQSSQMGVPPVFQPAPGSSASLAPTGVVKQGPISIDSSAASLKNANTQINLSSKNSTNQPVLIHIFA